MERLIGIKEASMLLGISAHTIRRWTAMKLIPYINLGRRILFKPTELEKWVTQFTVVPRHMAEKKDVR